MSEDKDLLEREVAEAIAAQPQMSIYELAELFTLGSPLSASGERWIDDRLAYSWYYNRARTGFPEAAGEREDKTRPVTVWDAGAAWAWYRDWRPGRGGAPKGNKNGLKHGKFAGVRAAQAAKRAGQGES